MADNVRFILDQLASLFRRMEESTIFTKEEVKAIVKKVTDFEYTLKRRVLEVEAYGRYVEYMLKLDELRQSRVDRRGLLNPSLPKELRQLVRGVESAFISHTAYIFNRATRRFPEDLHLYDEYIAFLRKKKATKLLNQLFGTVLSLHPKHEAFWVQASVHEIDANGNVHAARTLMQRGLRVNPSSLQLWQRYFELETWHALRTIERQSELGITIHGEDLLGAPMVVFTHALTALLPQGKNDSGELVDLSPETVECILEMLRAGASIMQPLANAMEKTVVAKLRFVTGVDALWHYFIERRLQRALLPELPQSENDVFDSVAVKGKKRQQRESVLSPASSAALDCVSQAIAEYLAYVEIIADVSAAENASVEAIITSAHLLVDLIGEHLINAAVNIKQLEKSTVDANAGETLKKTRGARSKSTKKEATLDAASAHFTDSLARYRNSFNNLLSMINGLSEHRPSASASWSFTYALLRWRLCRYCTVIGDQYSIDNGCDRTVLLTGQEFSDWVIDAASRVCTSCASASLDDKKQERYLVVWATVMSKALELATSTAPALSNTMEAQRHEKWSIDPHVQCETLVMAALCFAVQASATPLCCTSIGQELILTKLLPHLQDMDEAAAGEDAADTSIYWRDVAQRFDHLVEQKGSKLSRGDLELLQHSKADQTQQFGRWSDCYRRIILLHTSCIPSEVRCQWCARYVTATAAVCGSASAGYCSYEWVMKCVQLRPHLFHHNLLIEVYDATLEVIESDINIDAVTTEKSSGQQEALEWKRKILQRAVEDCPDARHLWEALEATLYAVGDNTAAMHTHWRRQQLGVS